MPHSTHFLVRWNQGQWLGSFVPRVSCILWKYRVMPTYVTVTSDRHISTLAGMMSIGSDLEHSGGRAMADTKMWASYSLFISGELGRSDEKNWYLVGLQWKFSVEILRPSWRGCLQSDLADQQDHMVTSCKMNLQPVWSSRHYEYLSLFILSVLLTRQWLAYVVLGLSGEIFCFVWGGRVVG